MLSIHPSSCFDSAALKCHCGGKICWITAVVYVLFSRSVRPWSDQINCGCRITCSTVNTVGSPGYPQPPPPTSTLKRGRTLPPLAPPSPLPFLLPVHLPPLPLRRWALSSFPSPSISPPLFFLQLQCIIKFLVEVRPPSFSVFSSPFLATSFRLPFRSLVNEEKKKEKVRLAWEHRTSLFFFLPSCQARLVKW